MILLLSLTTDAVLLKREGYNRNGSLINNKKKELNILWQDILAQKQGSLVNLVRRYSVLTNTLTREVMLPVSTVCLKSARLHLSILYSSLKSKRQNILTACSKGNSVTCLKKHPVKRV